MGAAIKLFVPGRICLFGEHSDWAGGLGKHRGFCLVVGTDQGLSATAMRADAFSVEMPVAGGDGRTRQMGCPAAKTNLLCAAQDQDEFFRYCAGTAYAMMDRHDVGGLDLRITMMDLPLKKGVSSSAAVCILVAKAFDAVYNLGLFPHELMDIAYTGERLTGSQCGRMDQACIYGKTPVLLSFDNSGIRTEPAFPARRMDLFFVDLAGEKDTVQIIDDLRRAYPKQAVLREALGENNEKIVRCAYRALNTGNAKGLGRLMTMAQENFDRSVAPFSLEQLTSPRLHELLAFAEGTGYVYGGKGVGSQGDGTAQFVAHGNAERDEAMARIEETFPQMQCFPLTIFPSVYVAE